MNRLYPDVFLPHQYVQSIVSILKEAQATLDWDFKALYLKVLYDFKESATLAYYHEAGSPLPDSPEDAEGNPGPWNSPLDWGGFYPLKKSGGPTTTKFRYHSWAELHISLQTGEVTCKQKNNNNL
jgi:hypothetical protein